MDFHGLQDNLRQVLIRRIRARKLSGLQLARQAGFRQPHICNFLHGKRGLSLDALDRVLSAQHLSILDLFGEQELNRRARIVPPGKDQFENVIMVDVGASILQPRFTRDQVRDVLKISKNSLASIQPSMVGDRSAWQRFIFLRASAREGLSMYPRLLPGACVLIDRHYNSFVPYFGHEQNMYAVLHSGHCYLRYAMEAPHRLVLHAENRAYLAHTLPLEPGTRASDYIVGRICRIHIDI